jgi:SAM-dependent methyltransferase
MLKTACRLCASQDLAAVAEFPPMPLVDAYTSAPNAQPLYPLGLRLCRACGHIQLSHVIDPALLYESGYLFLTADYPWLVEHYRYYALSAWEEFKPKHVFEIGSNDGTLLKFFEQHGCHVAGIDPSGVPSSVAVMQRCFTSQIAKHLGYQADMILANHVFAHIDDLADVVRGVKILLAPEGVFIFEAAYALDLLDHHYFDTIYHEHLDYHTVAPLVPFFERYGLQLFRIERNESKGGSIKGFVGHRAMHKQENSVHVAIAEELAAECQRPEVFHEFNARLTWRRAHVHEKLGPDQAIGYGAAAGGIATMYHLGLEDRVKWIVDDSPRRLGMFTPHANIPVRDPETLYSVRERDLVMPEAKCIILAWRYAEQIKKKHPNLEFIVP